MWIQTSTFSFMVSLCFFWAVLNSDPYQSHRCLKGIRNWRKRWTQCEWCTLEKDWLIEMNRKLHGWLEICGYPRYQYDFGQAFANLPKIPRFRPRKSEWNQVHTCRMCENIVLPKALWVCSNTFLAHKLVGNAGWIFCCSSRANAKSLPLGGFCDNVQLVSMVKWPETDGVFTGCFTVHGISSTMQSGIQETLRFFFVTFFLWIQCDLSQMKPRLFVSNVHQPSFNNTWRCP